MALPFPLLLITVWEAAVAWDKVANLPSPWVVAEAMVDLAGGERIFGSTLSAHLAASTQRVATGFLVAAVLGIVLGILMGRSARLTEMLDPTLSLLRPIPVTAWAPLMVVIVGIGSRSTIVLIVIASFFPMLINTVAGVRAVPVRLLEAAAMLGTGRREVLWRVVLPAAAPSIFAGARIGLGFSWVVLVVGETVGVRTGLGALIIQAWQVSRTEMIIAGMFFIGLAGFLSDRLLTGFMRLALRGRPMIAN